MSLESSVCLSGSNSCGTLLLSYDTMSDIASKVLSISAYIYCLTS
nr:MAG TPA: hypothetical protein [Bacteriophage sp.]